MITLIGLGACKHPDSALLPLIHEATLLAGRDRHLSLFPDFRGARLPLVGSIHLWIDEIIRRAESGPVVVLADGDPLFYGMGKWFNRRLPSSKLRYIPAPTALQQAIAAVGLEWGQALLLHAHRASIPGLVSRIQLHSRIGLLTSPSNTPVRIARHLLTYHERGWRVWVAERLGAPEERISEWTLEALAELADDHFDLLNVMLLDHPRHLPWNGFPMHCDDRDYQLPDTLSACISRRSVRALATGLMHLTPYSRVWEIGAGAATLGIEAAKIAYQGEVICFEENPQHAELCTRNARNHRVDHLQVITEPFTDQIAQMPPPDAVFVGNADHLPASRLRPLLERLKPGCRLVIPFRSRAALDEFTAVCAAQVPHAEICHLQQGNLDQLEPCIYLLHGNVNPL